MEILSFINTILPYVAGVLGTGGLVKLIATIGDNRVKDAQAYKIRKEADLKELEFWATLKRKPSLAVVDDTSALPANTRKRVKKGKD